MTSNWLLYGKSLATLGALEHILGGQMSYYFHGHQVSHKIVFSNLWLKIISEHMEKQIAILAIMWWT